MCSFLLGGNGQDLADVDDIRIGELVGLGQLGVERAGAVELVGDIPQAVARDDGVGIALGHGGIAAGDDLFAFVRRDIGSSGLDGDAALRGGILLADHTAEIIDDVVDEDLVVDHHAVLEELDVLGAEHGVAVAGILEHVVMGGEGVGLVDVEGLTADHDVRHTVRAVDLDELGLIVLHHGAGNVRIDGVGQAGNLQEAAALAGIGRGAELQSVLDLLTGDLNEACLVAEGMNLDDIAVGDVADLDVVAHAAAVDEGDVSAQQDAVGVRAQVAEVGLGIADRALAVRAVDGQLHAGLGNDLLLQGVELIGDGLDIGRRLGVGLDRVQINVLVGDGTVGLNDDLADVGELGAGLLKDDLLAGLILDRFGEGGVGVAVDEGVKAGGVGNDFLAHPRRGLLVDAEMAEADDIIGARGLSRIDGLLHRIVEVSAVVALAEAIDVVAVGVLEVGGGGLGKGLRRADADERDLHALDLEHLISVEVGLAVLAGEVCGDIGILRQILGNVQELIHAIVELMIAGNGSIVLEVVHDVDDVLALGERADHAALNMVARIHEQIRVLVQRCDLGILLVVAVNIVGVQNGDVFLEGGGIDRHGKGKDHRHRQQQGQKLAHSFFPPVNFCRSACPYRVHSFGRICLLYLLFRFFTSRILSP